MTRFLSSQSCKHIGCPNCGSDDNLAVYPDGSSHCFTYISPDEVCRHDPPGTWDYETEKIVNNRTINKYKETKVSEFIEGEVKAINPRGLTEKTCKKWDYRVGKGIHPTSKQIEPCHITNYFDPVNKELVWQKLRFSDKEMTMTGKFTNFLYGQWLWNKGKILVITEGEIDALSVSQAQNYRFPVVSVPNGAQGARKSIINQLEWIEGNFDKIVFMFDQDKEGKAAALDCATILSPGKAFIATLTEKDANECLLKGKSKEILDAIFTATAYKPKGIFTVRDLIPKLTEKPDFGFDTPWPSLNSLTYGLRPNQVWTWTSGTGMGKTTFFKEMVNHIIKDGKHKVAVVFLEENEVKTLIDLAGRYVDKPFNNPNFKYEMHEVRTIAEELDKKNLLYISEVEFEWEKIKNRIRYFVVAEKCKFIFLDHITAFTDSLEGSAANAMTERIMKDVSQLKRELDCNIQLIAHIRKSSGGMKPAEEGGRISLDDLKGSGAIKQWSDFVIGLERNQQAEDTEEAHTTLVRILKARDVGKNVGKYVYVRYNEDTERVTEVSQIDESKEIY